MSLPFTPCPKPTPKPKKRPQPMRPRSATKREPRAIAGAVPKEVRVKDPEHLDRVRALPCAFSVTHPRECGGWSKRQLALSHPSEACHVDNEPYRDDNRVFNACPNHHRLRAYSWHVMGRKRFQAKHKWNADAHAAALYDATLAIRGKVTP